MFLYRQSQPLRLGASQGGVDTFDLPTFPSMKRFWVWLIPKHIRK
jgi:hypothetical protein